VSRIERGHLSSTSLAVLETLAAEVEARLVVRLEWNGEGLARLLDQGHARAVEQVVRTLRELGWENATEVTFAIAGERGSIDVLAFHRETGTLLVIEVKTVIPDLQATQSALDRKTRLAARIARDLHWSATTVGRILAVVESSTARRRVEMHAATFATHLPHRGRDVWRFLRAPGPWSDGPLRALWFLSSSTGETPRHRISPRRCPPALDARTRISDRSAT
jgi:hypothetical protein